VRWHKLGEVKNEYTSENFVLFAIFVPKIFKIALNLTKFWQKISLHSFFETRCIIFFVVDSVCLSVCQTLLLLFVSRWNRAIFLAVSSPCALLQNFFFDFWFRPPKAQNLLPKTVGTKSPISRLVWHRPEMFGPTRGFSGMADSMEP